MYLYKSCRLRNCCWSSSRWVWAIRHYCHVSSLVLPRDSHSADYVETQRERLLFPEQSHDQRFGRTDLWGGSHGRLPGYRDDIHHNHGRQTHSSCPLAQPDFLQSVQQRDRRHQNAHRSLHRVLCAVHSLYRPSNRLSVRAKTETWGCLCQCRQPAPGTF